MGRLGAVIHKAFRSAGRDWVYFLSILGQTQRCISRLWTRLSNQGPSARTACLRHSVTVSRLQSGNTLQGRSGGYGRTGCLADPILEEQ